MILLLIYGPYLLFGLITLFCGKIFSRAGLAANKAWTPLINVLYWFKIAGVRPGWAIFFFVPYINLLFIFILVLAILKRLKAKTTVTTWSFLWIDIVLFILLKRMILNTFIFSTFSIPTSSMEKTFMTGELIIAEKISYGPRLPVTPLSIPFLHSNMPNSGKPSYLSWIQLPYYRFPGNTTIARNDVVVFNYPVQNQLPVDKREYYMKRCVALPGDTLQITDGVLIVNGQRAWQPPLSEQTYAVQTDGASIDFHTLEAMGITDGGKYTTRPGLYLLGLTVAARDSLKNVPHVIHIEPSIRPKGWVDVQSFYFPPDTALYKWNPDQYGPLVIPKKGVTVSLIIATLPLYQRIITVYEHNRLEIQPDSSIIINGKKTDHYTFDMNYYFMMGDNRDNSEDSRFWGFVPEDHIDSKVWKGFYLPFKRRF